MGEIENKKIIRRFRNRLKIEAALRAGTMGLMGCLAGMSAVLLYGRLRWQKLILSEAAVAAVLLFFLITVFLYVLVLRPKKKEVLKRIDSLGLQERMITMEELRQETTVLAEKQRQDAREHLAELNVKLLKPRLYIKPLLCCLVLGILVAVLVLLPFPEEKVDGQAEQNAREMQLVDEMITALTELVKQSETSEEHKKGLQEIVDALAVSFTPEDSTLTRTAKIATASKRLDMYASAEKAEVTLLKQQVTEAAQEEEKVKAAEEAQKILESTVKQMKDIMGTSIDVLNKVEGTFWTPGGPTSGTSYDVEPLPPEEEQEAGEEQEPPEGEEPGEGEEPPEGMEPGEGTEPQEGEMNGTGGETIFDPEQGEVSYGSVYEEYYKEILKALTEQEFSEEIREMIEDYANSLE